MAGFVSCCVLFGENGINLIFLLFCFSQNLKRKPMPKLVYTLLSEKDLRKRLSEVGLPTYGNRQASDKHLELFVVNTVNMSVKNRNVSRYTCRADYVNRLNASVLVTTRGAVIS